MNYLTVGTNKISTDLFQNIENKSGPKPYGGIWATPHNELYTGYNEWVDFLCVNSYMLYYKNSNDPYNLPACFITLKDDVQIFEISKKEDIEYLKQKFPHNDWIDFEKLSQHYDGIYINFNKLKHNLDKDMLNQILPYVVSTLILFNPYCIKYYQKAQVTLERIGNATNPLLEYKIIIEEKKETIENPNKKIETLLESIRKFIQENHLSLNEESFELIKKIFNIDIKETLSSIDISKSELLLIRKSFQSI